MSTFAPASEIMVDNDERIGEMERWVAAHDARTTELWRQQHKWNDDRVAEITKLHESIEDKFNAVFKRLSLIDRRLAWFSGIAAAVGGSIGSFIA